MSDSWEHRARQIEPGASWSAIAEDPFSRSEWLQAVRAAPSIKEKYFTVLSSRDVLPEVERILAHDPHLKSCFRD